MLQRICKLLHRQVHPRSVVELLWAMGTTVPADGTAGYEPGCLFQHTDGSTNTALYINEGTSTSCDFNAVSALGNVTATAAELNNLDLSAKTETITSAAKTITAGSRVVKITGGTGFTGVVLPVPTAAEVGLVKQITLDTITSGAVTMTLTNIAVGGTAAATASFDAAGETLVLVGAVYGATYRWIVLKEHGVTLS